MATQAARSFARITVDAEPHVAHIVLNHPPVNVIDVSMMEELTEAISTLEADGKTSVLVISGAGRSFSAGVDVAAHTPERVEEMLNKFHAVIRALVASKMVTIARVHGNCLGGGAEVAMVCDFVYTSDVAGWGFPEIKLACHPPVAVAALGALVGQKRAADLILSGRTITGTEAAELGLATRAVPSEQLDEVTSECVHELKRLSPAALAVTKKALYAWDSIHFDKGLARAEKIYREDLLNSEDAREGVAAFLQKREPKWKGR
jgi:cyclohexa-1,5-dienecarbonyl-CoA hydratase